MASFKCLLLISGIALLCIHNTLGFPGEKANVKLYMYNVDKSGFFGKIVIGSLNVSNEDGKQWAVVVQFDGDHQVYLCELNREKRARGRKGILQMVIPDRILNMTEIEIRRNVGGVVQVERVEPAALNPLFGTCKRMSKEEVQHGKSGTAFYNLGEISMTAEDLQKLGNEISLNGEDYHLYIKNSQHWANELIGRMGLTNAWYNIKSFLKKTTGPEWIRSQFVANNL